MEEKLEMHEWSLASDFIARIEEEAKQRGASKITNIKMKIGSLSGVSVEAFKFAFSVGIKESIISEDALKIEEISAVSKCSDCDKEFSDTMGLDACPYCGSYSKKLVSGNEMFAVSFEMEEKDV